MQGLKQMLSWLFGDLFYWLAIIAVIGGVVANVLALMVGFIPTLKPHAFIMKVVGIILIILGGYYVADHRGYQRRVDEDQAEIERLNGEARAKEAELNKKITQANTALKRAKDDIQSKQASLNARADVGELRLPSTCGVQTDSSTPSSGGDKASTGESQRQVIKDIVAIATDGDTAIHSLNACIAQYEQVRQTVNEGVK